MGRLEGREGERKIVVVEPKSQWWALDSRFVSLVRGPWIVKTRRKLA